MGRLSGKVAVVTGGNSGIGLASAKAFIKEGAAAVYITGRNQEALDAAASQLGPKAIAVQADAAKLEDIEKLLNQVQADGQKIDVLFINAGIAPFALIADCSEELLDTVMNINFRGPYFLIQKSIPLLNDNASIILNGSIAINKGMPRTSAYAASKAALASLAKSVSAELIGRGIRANLINPGPIDTPIFDKLGLPKEAAKAFEAHIVESIPMKRMGQVSDIANAVVYLASDESSFVAGTTLNIDGGITDIFTEG